MKIRNTKSLVEFGEQVRNICKGIQKKAIIGMSESDGSGANTGSDLVGSTIVSEIFDGLKYESKIWGKAKVYDVSGIQGNTFIQPFFNSSLEDEPSSGTRCYFVDEGFDKTESIPQTDSLVVKLGKLTVKVTLTSEILEDYERLADYVITEATSKIAQKFDKNVFLGVGKCIKGVMGDGDNATVTQSAADVFSEANAVSFLTYLHPMAGDANWYIAKGQEATLLSQSYAQGNAIETINGVPHLYGKAITVIPGLTTNPYHVCLASFDRYTIFHKGITIRKDEVKNFLTDQVTILVEMRIAAGQAVNTTNLDDGVAYGWAVAPTGGEAQQSSSSSIDSSSSSIDSSSSSTSESSESSSSTSESSESSSSSSNQYSESSSSESSSSSSGV